MATCSGNNESEASFTTDFNGSTIDGHSKLGGTLAMTRTVESATTDAAFVMQMVGQISISGDISDFLRANITERMT